MLLQTLASAGARLIRSSVAAASNRKEDPVSDYGVGGMLLFEDVDLALEASSTRDGDRD